MVHCVVTSSQKYHRGAAGSPYSALGLLGGKFATDVTQRHMARHCRGLVQHNKLKYQPAFHAQRAIPHAHPVTAVIILTTYE